MSRTVCAVAGATGLVGGSVLRRLLDDPEVERVVAPTRRPLAPRAKLENPLLTGPGWPTLPALDEAYVCVGTTRADAGSAEAFRAVDLDLALAFALAAKAAGAHRLGLVSAVGADRRSRFLYPRTKGEVEFAMNGLDLETLVIARPSLLLGERAQPRAAERVAAVVMRLLGPFLIGPLRRYLAVAASDVASALIAAVRAGAPGVHILEYDLLRGD